MYQWQRDGTIISGATGGTYTLANDDVGSNISVMVSYTDVTGILERVTSDATGTITSNDNAPGGSVTIAGTPTEDQMLTADISGISDADSLGAFSYQWLRGGVAIGG